MHLVPAIRADIAVVQPTYNAIPVEHVSARQMLELALIACRVKAYGALGIHGQQLQRGIVPQQADTIEELLDSQHP